MGVGGYLVVAGEIKDNGMRDAQGKATELSSVIRHINRVLGWGAIRSQRFRRLWSSSTVIIHSKPRNAASRREPMRMGKRIKETAPVMFS